MESMGRHVKVVIEVSAGQLIFVDDKGRHGPDEHIGASEVDTVEWISHDGDIEITFSDGGLFASPPTFPIRAQKNHAAGPYDLNPNHSKAEYKYTATVIVNGNRITQDPKIIFDVVLDGQGKSGFPSADAIATAAETAWEKVVQKLISLKAAEDTSGIQFYPHGITNIVVSVAVTPVTVSVQVQGPDA
jgi:hypothetical protein